jgi:hypothetical protein
MGYFVKGIANVLSTFGHEQYPSNSVEPMVIIEYN